MRQDPNGNLLSSTKLTSTVRRRRLAYLVELNLTPGSPGTVKDTTTWSDGGWLDVTEDVESVSGNMAIVPPYTSIMQIGSVPPASCQIVLRNVAKYSPNRTDSTLYTQLRMDSGSGGIYQLPVRVRVGFYDDPSLTPAASTTLASGMSATTYRQTDSASLSASKNAGCIIQVDSEQMVLCTTGTSVTVTRGFNGTTIASHSAGATVSVIGAMPRHYSGVVHSFREGSRGRTIMLTCFDRSYLLNQAKITSPSGATLITQDSTADTIIGQYADALPASPVYLPVPSGQRSLDNGLYPVNFAWADDSSAWTEIAAVASADGGVAFFDKAGVLKFFNSQHYIGAASQYTFDTLNMGDLSIDYDYNAIFSETTATYSAQVVAPSQTIYALSETMIVPAGTVGAAATTLNMGGGLSSSATSATLAAAGGLANNDYIVIDQEQMLITAGGGTTGLTITRGQMGTTAAAHANGASVYKVTAGTYSTVIQFYSPTTSVTTPTQITSTTGSGDWQAVTGGGTLLTDGVTLSMTNYAQRSSLTFTNKSAFYAAYITKFQLFGTPVQGFPARKVVQTKTTTPSGLAKRAIRLAPNFYWQDEAQANGVVEMLADRWKTGRNIITLRDCPGVPQLELGDMVTVTEATALTSSVTGFVMRMAWDLGTGREPSFKQTLELADSTSFYQNSNYFIVGTDALGSTKKYYY